MSSSSVHKSPVDRSASVPERGRDEDVLASMGYKQEFKRDFKKLELFGLSFTIVGVVQSIAAVLLYSIPYGGLASMIWGWFTCSIFLIFVGLAMAELGSAAPTAGGLYYWTFKFSSPRTRKLMSWLVGYINTAAYIAGVASVDWGCATQIMAAATISSDMTFVATNAQLYGVYAALLLMHAIMASLATKVIARLQYFYVFLNIALFLAVIIALPATTPSSFVNNAKYAFTHWENMSGWPNGFAFILSFLAPAWTVAGFDTSVHISEEAQNAPRAVPFAIMSTVVLASTLGWIVNIVLAFHIGQDLEAVVGNPIGQPMATIFFNSVGKNGTLAIWAFMIITLFMTGMDYLIAGSRQIFAFSRDHGLPFSGLLYKMNPRTKTPVNAVCFVAFGALLLGLISFAGAVAITAVFTMSVVCQYIGFTVPMVARWVGGTEFVPGPFYLGKLSLPITTIASSYMTFMIVVFLFPADPAPDSSNMNYTLVVVGGVLLLSLGYYYLPVYGGAHWFTGPVATVERHGPMIQEHDDAEKKGEMEADVSSR
ncbi:amino acid/polyamine transporter I [Schizophyllum amplum]|uniref:Amino acid/polyamine transporter I n=1 Tax=Schizophyllum amplum TaxID=97359 RepID=A0A550CWL6_9AGAR|nr:amino acid/polyamine transporter I [Auriculariopsis ampla]